MNTLGLGFFLGLVCTLIGGFTAHKIWKIWNPYGTTPMWVFSTGNAVGFFVSLYLLYLILQ